MFDHMDGIRRALVKKQAEWKEDLFVDLKFAWQKLSKYYAEVTPMMCMFPISAHILHPFRKLRLFRKCDNGMDVNPEHMTCYTT
jgi:hypothetical protein